MTIDRRGLGLLVSVTAGQPETSSLQRLALLSPPKSEERGLLCTGRPSALLLGHTYEVLTPSSSKRCRTPVPASLCSNARVMDGRPLACHDSALLEMACRLSASSEPGTPNILHSRRGLHAFLSLFLRQLHVYTLILLLCLITKETRHSI